MLHSTECGPGAYLQKHLNIDRVACSTFNNSLYYDIMFVRLHTF